MNETTELIRGSGNVFRDFEDPQADLNQLKAILAAKIIGVLDDEGLSIRKAGRLTGVDHGDFSRIRQADLGRFTVDRLMKILNRLDRRVEVQVLVKTVHELSASAK